MRVVDADRGRGPRPGPRAARGRRGRRADRRGRGLRPPALRRHPPAHHRRGRASSSSPPSSGTRAGTRVSFVCGHRALAAIARRQEVLDGLVATLSAPLDDLVAAARKAQGRPRRGRAEARRALLERALEGEARRLLDEARGAGPAPAAGPPAVIVAAYDGWPPDDLRVLATRLVALAPCVALLGSRSDKAHLVFAQSEGLPHDVPGPPQGRARAPRREGRRPRQHGPGRRRPPRSPRRGARPLRRRGSLARLNAMSPWLTLSLAVLFVSFGAILVRLAAAPPLAVSFYRVAIASLILLPFAHARRAALVAGARWPAPRCSSSPPGSPSPCTSPPGSRASRTPRSPPRSCS